MVNNSLRRKNSNSLAETVGLFVLREFRELYAGTLGGVVWNFLQPMFVALVYWWVFGIVWGVRVAPHASIGQETPFAVFLLSAMLPWLAFQEALNKSASSILNRAEVIRHGAFPVAIFPIAKVLAVHTVFAAVFFAFVLLSRYEWLISAPWRFLGILAVYLAQTVLAVSLGVLMASIAVYVRDLPHIVGMGLTVMMFTSPVLYPLHQIPESMQSLVWINPYTPFATTYQALILGYEWSAGLVMTILPVLAGSAAILAWWVYRRLRPGFADIV